jgi:flagellar biosynthesis/type III secretory pathway protein FliH
MKYSGCKLIFKALILLFWSACNPSTEQLKKSWEAGFQRGYEWGATEGYADGCTTCAQINRAEERSKGRLEGQRQGYQQGYQAAYREWMQKVVTIKNVCWFLAIMLTMLVILANTAIQYLKYVHKS